MGLYGIGRAFNLKYRPNGPLKTYVYDRRMPTFGFGRPRPPMGGGFSMMQENIFIDNSKRGFWGNLADICYGLTAGFSAFSQIFGMFKGNSQVDYAAMNQQQAAQDVKPQGANSDAELKNLQTLGKASGYTAVVKDPSGDTYTAYNPTTGDSITGDYKTVQEHMLKKPEKEPEIVKHEVKDNKQQVHDNEDDGDGRDPGNVDSDPEVKTGVKPQGTRKTRKAQVQNNQLQGTSKSNMLDENGKPKGLDKTDEIKDKKPQGPIKVPIHWEIRDKIFGLNTGNAIIDFDYNGNHYHFRANCSIPSSEGGIKSILAQDLRMQLEQAGLKDKVTI